MDLRRRFGSFHVSRLIDRLGFLRLDFGALADHIDVVVGGADIDAGADTGYWFAGAIA